jgi:putative ABC transport system permease protein
MTAAVWERRRLLATYKLEGVRRRQLGGMLLLEALLVLGVGCALGSVVGVYGHLLGSRWLQLTTGYAAPFSVQVEQAVLTLISITLVSLAIVAVPGYLAARVPARLRFQE